jgi:hypothetical protein
MSKKIKIDSLAGSNEIHGYKQIKIDGVVFKSHRVIWLIVTGEWPNDTIDHVNGIKNDNRWMNLRDVPHSENQKNIKRPRDNTSGVAGVGWCKTSSMWRAHIQHEKKHVSLGRYNDYFEAICARKSAEHRCGYHANHGRN